MTKAILMEMFFSESTCASADEDAATSAAKTVTRPNRTDIESSLSTTRCPSTADGGRGAWRIMSHPGPFDNGPPATEIRGQTPTLLYLRNSVSVPNFKSINIKNEEAASLVAELTAATGKGTTELILELLRHEAGSRRRFSNLPKRRKRIDAILRRARKKISKDAPPTEQLIQFDRHGLPR